MQTVLTVTLAALAIGGAAHGGGKLVVANDEWTLSDSSWSIAGNQPGEFALNVASWFTGGKTGRFLVPSTDFGLTGNSLRAAMEGAGHEWVVDSSLPFTVETLETFDAVFMVPSSFEWDVGVLSDYIAGGGNAYLGLGTGTASIVAQRWQPFFAGFGLEVDTSHNGIGGVIPIDSAHPIFDGITGLYQNNGTSVFDLDETEDCAEVLVEAGAPGEGMYAASECEFCSGSPDIDGTGMVGFDDLVLLLGNWGPCAGCPADLDCDGSVGFDDLVLLLGNWG
jgi:hypothetical protein